MDTQGVGVGRIGIKNKDVFWTNFFFIKIWIDILINKIDL